MTAVIVRPAIPDDVVDLHRLLIAFGRHGGYEDWMTATPDMLEQALFAEPALRFAHVAIVDGVTVGMALWFLNFNFGRCQPGLYLEDLYVDAAARGKGAGEALMQALAAEAVRRECLWMDWAVLVDNPDAKRFYARLGAERNAIWEPWRLEEAAMRALAGRGLRPALRHQPLTAVPAAFAAS